jgi:hypothetical protein
MMPARIAALRACPRTGRSTGGTAERMGPPACQGIRSGRLGLSGLWRSHVDYRRDTPFGRLPSGMDCDARLRRAASYALRAFAEWY